MSWAKRSCVGCGRKESDWSCPFRGPIKPIRLLVVALALCGNGWSCCLWAFYYVLLRAVAPTNSLVPFTSAGVQTRIPRLLPPFQPASTSTQRRSPPFAFRFSSWECLTTDYRVATEHLLSFVQECLSFVVMDGSLTAMGKGSGYRHYLRLETGGALVDLEAMQVLKSKPYSILGLRMRAVDLRLASYIASPSIHHCELTILSFLS